MINSQTDRLIFSLLKPTDARRLFEFYSDAEAMRFRGSGPMASIEDAHEMIANQNIEAEGKTKQRLAIRRKSDDSMIGTLLLVIESSVCEVGFSFGQQFWNRGYASETLAMVEKHFQTEATITELKAWVVKENEASVRLFQKAGFEETPQSRFPGSILFFKSIG